MVTRWCLNLILQRDVWVRVVLDHRVPPRNIFKNLWKAFFCFNTFSTLSSQIWTLDLVPVTLDKPNTEPKPVWSGFIQRQKHELQKQDVESMMQREERRQFCSSFVLKCDMSESSCSCFYTKPSLTSTMSNKDHTAVLQKPEFVLWQQPAAARSHFVV